MQGQNLIFWFPNSLVNKSFHQSAQHVDLIFPLPPRTHQATWPSVHMLAGTDDLFVVNKLLVVVTLHKGVFGLKGFCTGRCRERDT